MITFIPFIVLQSSPIEPAMAFSKRLVGGVWVAKTPNIVARLRFSEEADGKFVVGVGDIEAGTARMRSHSFFGWDPIKKLVYYLDTHEHDTVYHGHCHMEGDTFVNDFQTLVGSPGHWVQRAKLTDSDTLDSTLFSVGKDGKETETHQLVFKRSK